MNRIERNAHMSGTALFIRRPILAFVLNALIVIAGLAGLLGADVRELPDVDRPVVTVSTSYSGAAPEAIDREVTAVIEGAFGRWAGSWRSGLRQGLRMLTDDWLIVRMPLAAVRQRQSQ